MPEPLTDWEGREALVTKFLENVRGTIPLSIEQVDAILRLVVASGRPVHNFLDLACAGGVLASAVLDEYPEARAEVIAPTGKDLEGLRQQLGSHSERVDFQAARLDHADWVGAVQRSAPFDLAVSEIEIPLLPDHRKREIFSELYDLLAPGALYLNVEHVATATRFTESRWDDQMIDTIFGDLIRPGEKKPRAEIAREYYERLKDHEERVAPLEVQCDWLREIGFEAVECYLKISELAVFGGQKPQG